MERQDTHSAEIKHLQCVNHALRRRSNPVCSLTDRSKLGCGK